VSSCLILWTLVAQIRKKLLPTESMWKDGNRDGSLTNEVGESCPLAPFIFIEWDKVICYTLGFRACGMWFVWKLSTENWSFKFQFCKHEILGNIFCFLRIFAFDICFRPVDHIKIDISDHCNNFAFMFTFFCSVSCSTLLCFSDLSLHKTDNKILNNTILITQESKSCLLNELLKKLPFVIGRLIRSCQKSVYQ
jgi:hypothetical protein